MRASRVCRPVREQRKLEVVKEYVFEEFPAASHADLLEGASEVVLDGVLGDVEIGRDLPGGSTARYQSGYLPFPRAQAVECQVEEDKIFGLRQFDDDHRLGRKPIGLLGQGAVER